ncbi:hypothetical protein F5Y03DRAFT_98836 [Xylaria venustula]|nr:hypothetical protein F5Y03DRAFT_98836 [Xylaria venustula]
MISLKERSADMSPPGFTFVTAVGTAGLSETAAKEMRSHVTKSNFAKRRERLARKRKEAADKTVRELPPKEPEKNLVTVKCGSDHPKPPSQQTYGDSYTRYLSSKWSLLFLDGSKYPATANEAAWVRLLLSEPALVESSMAFGVRHWSLDREYQQVACDHFSKATENIIQRIASGQGTSDAVLASVLTMAFGERLVNNHLAWNVHIDGAVQLVNERILQGLPTLPPMLKTILTVDITNDVFGFPRFYHKKFIDTARTAQDDRFSSLVRLADVCDNLACWMQTIDESRIRPRESRFMMEHIVQPMHDILSQSQAIREDSDVAAQASCITIELIIYLSWSSLSRINLTSVASELKDAICASQFRPCRYSDLTSCQLMIGAIAADKGSPTRAWFMDRMSNAWRIVKSRGCNDVMDILRSNMRLKTSLESQFRSLWMELDSQSRQQVE